MDPRKLSLNSLLFRKLLNSLQFWSYTDVLTPIYHFTALSTMFQCSITQWRRAERRKMVEKRKTNLRRHNPDLRTVGLLMLFIIPVCLAVSGGSYNSLTSALKTHQNHVRSTIERLLAPLTKTIGNTTILHLATDLITIMVLMNFPFNVIWAML